MVARVKDLWSLVKYRPEIDPNDLALAVEHEAGQGSLDYRTRLLIRDSVHALKEYWGSDRLSNWLARCPTSQQIATICAEDFERPGFPTIASRLMEKTDPEDIKRFLRELGTHIRHRIRVPIGGSAALILPGLLSRATDDVDVVDEVPKELRSAPKEVEEISRRYSLKIAHFQQHYLPMGWEQRLHYFDSFGEMQVFLVDPYDVFLSKLYSIRPKDIDDMRALVSQLDKSILARRLLDTTSSMLAAQSLKERAEKNWYILFGEALPT
jgi:hypothetical protein